jgi:predicted N-formylglutamate amidohydrolase
MHAPLAATPPDASFAPFERIDGPADAGVLVLCDHASNAIPEHYADLGLPPAALQRHIAYDIGAAWLTRKLARLLNAPAALSCFSRLLIDANRGADDPTLVMQISDGAIVPGNARLDAAEIALRIERYWTPYREAVAAEARRMSLTGVEPAIVSVHSFTPLWRGVERPWRIGLLWDADARLAEPLARALARESDLAAIPDAIGDNEPYDGALQGDTIDEVATAHGRANVLIEVRQDLIATQADAEAWADRLARLLTPILSAPELHERQDHGTRARGNPRIPARALASFAKA